MTFLRLAYPGAGTDRGYAGELAPETQRLVRRAGVVHGVSAQAVPYVWEEGHGARIPVA